MPQLTGDSTVDIQYRKLREAIIDGTYLPGSVLLETAISKEYGVSRTPAREALTRLTQDGWVVRSRRGYQVRIRSTDEIVDLFDARIALEGSAAALACERRTTADLDLLDHLLKLRSDTDDSSVQAKLNKQWHVATIEASHNASIIRFTTELRIQLQIYQRGYEIERAHFGDEETELREHIAITDALRNRDSLAARELVTTHLTRGRNLRIAAMNHQSLGATPSR